MKRRTKSIIEIVGSTLITGALLVNGYLLVNNFPYTKEDRINNK